MLNKLRTYNQLKGLLPEDGVITTNGCFDILHPGHIQLLEQCRNYNGSIWNLVVLINSDASVRRYKGSSRPINSQADRAAMLSALWMVEYVAIFDEDTPCEALEIIKPNIHVKGGDWKKEDMPETAVVERNGGRVVIIPTLPGYSTTSIIDKAFYSRLAEHNKTAMEAQKEAIRQLEKEYKNEH